MKNSTNGIEGIGNYNRWHWGDQLIFNGT
jgi:hypothetical protein